MPYSPFNAVYFFTSYFPGALLIQENIAPPFPLAFQISWINSDGTVNQSTGPLPEGCEALRLVSQQESDSFHVVVGHCGSSVPACSATMYFAYQSGQLASLWPVRFSCSP